jgi:outer membrane protein assembly factor BamD (BamD/ComL family)
MFQKPKAEDIVDAPLTPEQEAFWDANRSRARYVPGRGWYVEGTSGYFDEEGRPIKEKKAPDPRSLDDDGRDGWWSKYLSLDANTARFKKLIGRGPNEGVAKAAFAEGESLYRAEKYHDAAKKFNIAYDRWPDSPLEEDALFFAGEAHFFANEYPKSDDAYGMLVKKYAGSTRLDNVWSRRFAIGRYWELKYDEHPHWPITPNFRDKSLPKFDTGGHALKCYESIWINDLKGPLADNAVMSTANFHFTHGHWEEADHFYTMLRKDHPKSDFQYNAHYFGLQAKLARYQGPVYTDIPLEGSDDLAEQLLTQFDRELGDERDRIRQVRAEIQAQYALREYKMGEYYFNTKYYGAAKTHFKNVIAEYPDTKLAAESKTKIEAAKGLPDSPTPPFAWVEKILPKSKRNGPELAKSNSTTSTTTR